MIFDIIFKKEKQVAVPIVATRSLCRRRVAIDLNNEQNNMHRYSIFFCIPVPLNQL